MKETPKQWAKRMWEANQKNPQFCLQAFIDRYREREKDYGSLKCYGPFTEEEFDEYDITYAVRTHAAEQLWLFSFDRNATYEGLIASFERFIQEQRPKEYEKFRKAKV